LALVERVLPAFAPDEWLGDEPFERAATKEVVECPAGRDMADEQHAPRLGLGRELAQKVRVALHGFAPALPTWERDVEPPGPLRVQVRPRHPVPIAVVAL